MEAKQLTPSSMQRFLDETVRMLHSGIRSLIIQHVRSIPPSDSYPHLLVDARLLQTNEPEVKPQKRPREPYRGGIPRNEEEALTWMEQDTNKQQRTYLAYLDRLEMQSSSKSK